MKIWAAFLTLLGAASAALALFGVPWLLAFGCGMNTTGCSYRGSFLIRAATSSDLTWFFWLALIFGAALILCGVRLFRIAGRATRAKS